MQFPCRSHHDLAYVKVQERLALWRSAARSSSPGNGSCEMPGCPCKSHGRERPTPPNRRGRTRTVAVQEGTRLERAARDGLLLGAESTREASDGRQLRGARVAESPAATTGQEEADIEVVLRMGIDGFKPEHGYLASKGRPLGIERNAIDSQGTASMKIGPACCGFLGVPVRFPAALLLSADRVRQSGSSRAR
jgi:hypothetical protein